jgi:hypothetical protein
MFDHFNLNFPVTLLFLNFFYTVYTFSYFFHKVTSTDISPLPPKTNFFSPLEVMLSPFNSSSFSFLNGVPILKNIFKNLPGPIHRSENYTYPPSEMISLSLTRWANNSHSAPFLPLILLPLHLFYLLNFLLPALEV